MRDHFQAVRQALKAHGEADALDAFVESLKVARHNVATHGVLLPEQLQPIDAIGARCFELDTTKREYEAALLRIVPDLRPRLRLDELVVARIIAEYRTYYWYGVAVGLEYGVGHVNFEEFLDRLLAVPRAAIQDRLKAYRRRSLANPRRRGPRPKGRQHE